MALLRGLVSDVEVHRCQSLIEETPHYKEYLIKANRLRDKYRRLILNGLFQDTDGTTCDNDDVSWSVFRAGEELALIATQSHKENVRASFNVPGYQLTEFNGLGQYDVYSDAETCTCYLSQHALTVMVLEKK